MPMIVAYQRSGSHYLQQLILQHCDLLIEKSHEPTIKSDYIITIARNPRDSIQSLIAMQEHYGDLYDIKELINAYIDFYQTLKPDFIVDYNSLIDNPKEVIKLLSKTLGLTYVDKDYKSDMIDRPNESYLISSKTSEKYNKRYFGKVDIADCIIPYKAMLAKKDI